MRPSTAKPDDLDLDLPELDGEVDGEAELAPEGLEVEEPAAGHSYLDDRTGEDDAAPELTDGGPEGGWLVDADAAGGLDVGAFDVMLQPEGKVLEDDEADAARGTRGLEDLVSGDEAYVVDGGEEGPLADDEELREEDLPALDADDDGDVADEALYDRGLLAAEDDLRWDDRAWARAPKGEGGDERRDEPDDSGILAVPGDDPGQSARDAAWKKLDGSGNVMAAAFVPGGSVVVALRAPDRARALLVRIRPDGEARIVAELTGDDDDPCFVSFLRWDAASGSLIAGGNFGVESYRPSLLPAKTRGPVA